MDMGRILLARKVWTVNLSLPVWHLQSDQSAARHIKSHDLPQSTLASLALEPLLNNVLLWLEDIPILVKNAKGLQEVIRAIFRVLLVREINLHPVKCNLYNTTDRWFVKPISRDSTLFNPHGIDVIRHMSRLITSTALQQHVCALKWVKTAIADFKALMEPLHLFLAKAQDPSSSHWEKGRPMKRSLLPL